MYMCIHVVCVQRLYRVPPTLSVLHLDLFRRLYKILMRCTCDLSMTRRKVNYMRNILELHYTACLSEFCIHGNSCAYKYLQMYQGQWEKITQDVPEGSMFASAGQSLLATYQNPTEADKILKVQKDLDEVKDVMLKNIDELLQRGESLDALMQKSENLSSSAYQLYRQGKRVNQCCKWY
ncbi:hypothetical protein IE077_004311 [Cardiosporidium cionae]|uniref:V-SNARE coiled-coil homology domain-containing protein n=1 Tax=Cardiosporidium cionae TaxID=476202 RepID=A0ABQ7JC48_9APIC|nr:hypothetical protein IE077_004311 [Cardiosporidium cionae]|eukprot:KAF8821603.1 hypothetical protein IE077_004311 [Cardiosporidium cionae]